MQNKTTDIADIFVLIIIILMMLVVVSCFVSIKRTPEHFKTSNIIITTPIVKETP